MKKMLCTALLILLAALLLGCNRQEYEPVVTDSNYYEEVEAPDDEYIEEDIEVEAPVVGPSGIPENYATFLTEEESLSYLALVNRHFRLSDTFSPPDLSFVQVPTFGDNQYMRATAARATELLFADAQANGYYIFATSGFRSYTTQHTLHHNFINQMGESEARRVSARPGHSEHQLGLAMDITTAALGGLSEAFSHTPEGTWVGQNAHRFGFIIRYPANREADTGFIYEPWHIRYVGVQAATTIFNEGLILEEYLAR